MHLNIHRLGLIDFEECWALQRKAQNDLISGTGGDQLYVCRHPPVVTLGRSTHADHIGNARELLAKEKISLVEIERGGSITYHGPEQIVAYPIIDLHQHKRDVAWYMRQLEEVIIQTLKSFSVEGIREANKTGVWIVGSGGAAKIAFIGVRISRWCTMHGFSINLEPCSDRFRSFNPCGLGSIDIVSLAELIDTNVSFSQFEDCLIETFVKLFKFDIHLKEIN